MELSRLGLVSSSLLDHQAAIEDALPPSRLPRAVHTADLGLHHTEIAVALLRRLLRQLPRLRRQELRVVEVGTFRGQWSRHVLRALPRAEAGCRGFLVPLGPRLKGRRSVRRRCAAALCGSAWASGWPSQAA